MPALEAAKAAQAQDQSAFERYDLGLFTAFFRDNRDISDHVVLVELAKEARLDAAQLDADLKAGTYQRAVILDYVEAVRGYGITGVPTVILSDRGVVGAVPTQKYRDILDELLKEEAP